jgi:predicted MFS family arabinose efflux permease
MPPRFSLSALMLGNFIIGLGILAPAGMLQDLSAGLAVSIREAGFLITAGAVTLCIGSPLAAWLTSRIDRRLLLTGTLLIYAAGHLISALAPGYRVLLVTRIVMLAVAALYTPQAAGAAALIVPPERRASAIAFAFLGWSLAVAIGLPLVSLSAAHIGWRETYGGLCLLSLIIAGVNTVSLPAGLKAAPVSLATWSLLMRNRMVVLLLFVTAAQIAGQFVLFTYLGPLLTALLGAGPEKIGVFFALFGVAGFIGNLIATQIVGSLGAFRTSAISIGSLFLGTLIWALGEGFTVPMGLGAVLWGLGFAAANSMQQARLAAAVPEYASASIALNTSCIYIGQAIGSWFGGLLIAQSLLAAMGWTAVICMGLALLLVALTRPR